MELSWSGSSTSMHLLRDVDACHVVVKDLQGSGEVGLVKGGTAKRSLGQNMAFS